MIKEAVLTFRLPQEFTHCCALVGLFHPKRKILKNWEKNEELFINLVKKEGKIGKEHFMQSVVLYFIRFYKDNDSIQKYGPTFMKKMVDQNILSKQFILQWFDKETRLDKDCTLYDKPAEKKFRELIEDFVKWLRE